MSGENITILLNTISIIENGTQDNDSLDETDNYDHCLGMFTP